MTTAPCAGHCHCHAGADGMMHPPCCADCAPPASTGERGGDALPAEIVKALDHYRDEVRRDAADRMFEQHPPPNPGRARAKLVQALLDLRAGERSPRAGERLAALEEVATLARRFVREDPDRPGFAAWGHRIDDEGGDLGMDPDTFALAMDAALSRVEALPRSPRAGTADGGES